MSKAVLQNAIKSLSLLARGHGFHYASHFSSDGFFPQECASLQTTIHMRPEYEGMNENRVQNMKRAAALLSGLVLEPGDVFRFWKYVPRPSVHNGFLEGPAIRKGKLVKEPGGGLCQVSSTLYGVFLQAGFEIIERHGHSVDLHLENRTVPLGRDAAVVYGYKDLVVRNTTLLTLQLAVSCDELGKTFNVRLNGSAQKDQNS